ncbi:peptidoglycan-binding protein [Streptomyces antarcticus]|uniref:peptidoglycan-binding protein n=1 Tax=Streptomyces antarcticus TaxID=2996458 RepID=UPI002D1E4728|nr:peptidoglycan-binding protein [Streptomyces sp. H34-AA3]
MKADQFVKALIDEGVNVKEYKDWRSHNRNHKGAWGPVHGVVIHHTAGTSSLDLCYTGYDELPGPLCHTYLHKDGTAYMVGNGRANHAGTFAQNAVDAAVSESATHPRPDATEPVDGNSRFYGIEIENRGDNKDPYPDVQYKAAVRWAAAICRFHGWTADSVIGHKEGTRRKIDPTFDMGQFRKDVAAQLGQKPEPQPEKPTPPAPLPTNAPPFPGTYYFRPGAKNSFVTQLGRQLIKKGYGRFYKVGPGPQWTAVDRAAVRAFQVDQDWSGTGADGYPGPQTWKRLFS